MPPTESRPPVELSCVDRSCPHCAALAAELATLRAQVRELKRKNEDLARAAVERDYERPPHYQ